MRKHVLLLILLSLSISGCSKSSDKDKDKDKGKADKAGAKVEPKLCADAAACKASCESKDAAACVQLGRLLGVALDKPGAIAAYAKGCELGAPMGCAWHGYTTGIGRPDDSPEYKNGLSQLEKACAAEPRACGLFVMLDYDESVEKQIEMHVKACKAGEQGSCFEQARNTGTDANGEPVTGAAKEANDKLISGACAAGVLAACSWKKEGAERLAADEKNCNEGGTGWPNEAQWACEFASEYYAKGEVVTQDLAKADELKYRACQMGNAHACGAY